MCSSSPDTSGANAAALKNAQISQEALDWAKQVYAETAPDRASASAAAREQAALQRDLSLQSLTSQQEERQRYKDTFQPVENKIVADAMNYDTAARREQAAGQAVADVDSQVAIGRDTTMREMAARGVDPSSGAASLALARTGALSGTARAAAANKARQDVETLGNARLMDAAGLGRGVVSNQATQAQIGLNSGNSSVANANMPNVIAQQGAGQVSQGFQTAIQGNNSAGNLSLAAGNAQAGVDAANGQTAAAAGSAVAGIAIAI